MKDCKFDITTLIELVECSPCLWDKTIDEYKNKLSRQDAWKEIFRFLEPEYDTMEKRMQKITGDFIIQKWNNIRDTFIKSVKSTNGRFARRKYVYNDQLLFLIKTLQPYISDDAYLNPEEANAEGEIPTEREPRSFKRKKIKSESKAKFEELKKTNPSPPAPSPSTSSSLPPDEDEAFFLSVMPAVKRMSEDDKFDFRMRVMDIIREIKVKNRAQTEMSHLSESVDSYTGPSSSSSFVLGNSQGDQS